MAKLEHFISVGTKKMRCGYTTGTCAAAASAGALEMLITGKLPEEITIETPSGIKVNIEPNDPRKGENFVSCAVEKDAGDDPDVTDGVLVYAKVEKISGEGVIIIDGGIGVGRVTKPGLDQSVGEAAINRVPRQMIEEQIRNLLEKHKLNWSIKVTISIPGGEKLAGKTFNPRLGIEGGISVLGTSGIVRPMSKQAIVDSITIEMDMLYAAGKRDILITPGNYGDAFSKDVLNISLDNRVNCSNYIGDCIDHAVGLGMNSILVVGHIGKLAKVAAGNMNTHSRVSDGRREVLALHTALSGGKTEDVRKVFDCITTDGAIEYLDSINLRDEVMKSIGAQLESNLKKRAGDIKIEAIFFSNQYGLLGKTTGALLFLKEK